MKHTSLVIRLAGLLAAILLVAGCGTTPAPSALPIPTDTPTPEPSPTPLSALAILENAKASGEAGTSFHMDMKMDMTISGMGLPQPMTVPMTMVADAAGPTSMKGTMKLNVQGTTMETEMIVISDTVYIKDPTTGQWQSTQNQNPTPLGPTEVTTLDPNSMTDLTLVGEEEVDGRSTYHVSGKATLPLQLGEPLGDVDVAMDVNYWIEKETSHIAKVTMLGDVPLTAQITGTIGMSVTVLMSKYGEPVTVEPPANVTPLAPTVAP